MATESTILHDIAFMRTLLDLVIPPSNDGKLPGAGSLGLSTDLAPALEGNSVIVSGLQDLQDAARQKDPDGLTALEPTVQLELVETQLRLSPALMAGLTHQLYLAYYQHPTVLQGLGQPPRPPFPEGYRVEETDPRLIEVLEERARSL